MKNQALLKLVASLLLALAPLSLSAAVEFWDPDAATVGTSVSSNWDAVTTNWTASVDSGVNNAWTQGDDASFGIAANYTVTVTAPITVGNLTISGGAGILTITNAGGNSLTLGGASIFDTGGRSVNLSVPIGGASGLTRIGAGTVTNSGASTYSGGTSINAGTTTLAVSSVLAGGVVTSGPFGTGPVATTATAITLTASGARTLHNPITLNGNISINGSAALTLTNGGLVFAGANRTVTVGNTADTTLQTLADDGTARTFTKAGAGRLVMMTGTSLYLGGITASAGTLAAGSSTPFPTNSNNAITINSSTLDLNGFNVTLSRLAGNAAGKVLLGNNTLTAGNDVSSGEFMGVISGTGGYVKVGSISQVLSGTNTFSGGITITAGSLYLPTNGVSGSGLALGAGTNTITITGTGRVGANRASPSIAIVTNKVIVNTLTAGLDAASGGDFILAGPVSGPGAFVRTTQGSGFTVLAASNSFTGGVEVDARPFGLGDKNALGTGPFVIGNPTVPPGNTIELGCYNLDLIGANAVTNPVTINQDFAFGTRTAYSAFGLELSGPVTLAPRKNNIFLTGTGVVKISGVISGSGGISKGGDNTLILSANNTFTGATTVSNTTLALVASGSLSGSTNVAVLTGATLDVSGRADGTLLVPAAHTLAGSGAITGSVGVAGTLAPGPILGTLTISGNLAATNRAIFELDRTQSPNSDLVVVSGTLVGGGTLTVTNAGPGALAGGDSFTLFSKPVSGFTTVNLPVGYTWNNQLAASGTISVSAVTFPLIPTNVTATLSGANVNLSWPANYAGGWVLETSPDLLNWTTVPGSRDVSFVSIPISANPLAFYRLRLLTP